MLAVNFALEVGDCSFVKRLQEEEGDGKVTEVCGCCCCIFSRNTFRKQWHIVVALSDSEIGLGMVR